MSTEYHRLGDYIRSVDVRNREIKHNSLQDNCRTITEGSRNTPRTSTRQAQDKYEINDNESTENKWCYAILQRKQEII